MITIDIKTSSRQQMVDVTDWVTQIIADSGIQSGVAICFVPHTTAGCTIQENADPDVQRDLLDKLTRTFPQHDGYHHAEGNSDAHLKATLVGSSVQLIIENGSPLLGRWQGLFFCEFDGPRQRRLIVKVGQFA